MSEIGFEKGTGLKTPSQKLEGIAFTFCKIATVALLTGRFTLPVAAGLAAVFYVWAFAKGQRDTRCILLYPLLIATVWGVVAAISLWAILMPDSWYELVHRILPWIH